MQAGILPSLPLLLKKQFFYFLHMNNRPLKSTVDKLKALSDPTRIKLLTMLMAKSLCVCELTYSLKLAQPTISRHMQQLENAGFVSRERQGTWIIYSIDPQNAICRQLLDIVMEQAGRDKECMDLVARLDKIDRCNLSGDGRRRKV